MSVLRGKFSKTGEMKYISHLDLVRLFHRVLRRAGIDIAYSQGYNPHPVISFATALSLGVESSGEYFDLKLNHSMPIGEFQKKVNQHMPDGIRILKGKYIDAASESLMSMVEYSDYNILVDFDADFLSTDSLDKWLGEFLEQESILITRKKKKKRRQRHQEFKEVDVKPLIESFSLESLENQHGYFYTMLTTGSKGNLKPEDLIQLFEKYLQSKIHQDAETPLPIIDACQIKRRDLYQEVNGELRSLIDATK